MMPRPSRSVLHQVVDVERRLAEELGAALVLQHQQPALDRADRRRRRRCRTCVADLLGVLRQIGRAARAGPSGRAARQLPAASSSANLKAMLSTPSCDVVEIEHAREQQRAHLGHGGADRMALLAEQVPEDDREFVGLVFEADVLGALDAGSPSARPRRAMPDRSPLMSAANTGTPAREKPSASTCSVTVLPVPVAPVTRPWRLASCSVEIFRLAALADENLAVRIVRHCLPLVLGSEVLLSEA